MNRCRYLVRAVLMLTALAAVGCDTRTGYLREEITPEHVANMQRVTKLTFPASADYLLYAHRGFQDHIYWLKFRIAAAEVEDFIEPLSLAEWSDTKDSFFAHKPHGYARGTTDAERLAEEWDVDSVQANYRSGRIERSDGVLLLLIDEADADEVVVYVIFATF